MRRTTSSGRRNEIAETRQGVARETKRSAERVATGEIERSTDGQGTTHGPRNRVHIALTRTSASPERTIALPRNLWEIHSGRRE